MDINKFYEMQLRGFRLAYPNIQIPINHKSNFIKRWSSYTGLKSTYIEPFPGISDRDYEYLIVLDNLIDEMLQQSSPKVIDGDTGFVDNNTFLEKDVMRLCTIPSGSMEGTIANPDLLNTKYDGKFISRIENCLNILGDSLHWRPNINCVIRKRKGSSNGSFLGDNSEKTTSLLFESIKLNCLEGKWSYLLNILNFDGKYATKATTRRMIKAPKSYEDYTYDKGKITITRELEPPIRESLKLNHKLFGPKHRYVCNTSEAERVSTIFQMPVYNAFMNKYSFSLIPNLPAIDERLQKQLDELKDHCAVFMSDGNAYDKHITEDMMNLVEKFVSKFVEGPNHVYFTYEFRKLKDVFFPDGKGNIISSTNMAKIVHPQLKDIPTLLGLDSGHWLVSFFGKLLMSINIFSMLCDIFYLEDELIIDFLLGKLTIYDESLKRKVLVTNFNSSDDNLLICSKWIRSKIIQYLDKIVTEGKDALPMIPIEEDSDYLSMRVVLTEDKKELRLEDNIARRIVSMLKPEHGCRNSDGTYKDYVQGNKDRLETILKYDLGRKIIEKFEMLMMERKLFKVPNILDHLELVKDKFIIKESDQLPTHILATLNNDEKMLLLNHEYFYYKIDQSKIREELIDYLFFHVDINYLKPIYEALEIPFNM